MLRSWRKSLLLAALASFTAPAAHGAGGDALHRPRQPTTTPASKPSAQARDLINLLAALREPDPRAREAARRQLLALPASDLPSLVQAVRQLPGSMTSSSATAAALYDAVVHIHLREAKSRMVASVPPEDRNLIPFLGVSLGRSASDQSGGVPNGVSIRSSQPGFAAYEVFEDGDLLIAVRTERGLERLSHFQDLQTALYGLAPGDQVEFTVVRGGHVLRVPFQLDTRVDGDSGFGALWAVAHAEALRAAEAFWDEQLAPLLGEESATAAAQ